MKCLFQAHRGVSTEAPENTMSAFRCAAAQGYAYIEVDPNVTADGKIVLLHDETINRTARMPDGTPMLTEIPIGTIDYAKACEYDFGIGFSPKFAGEKIPLLRDVLAFAEKNSLRVKIANKFERFSDDAKETMFTEIAQSGASVAFTCATLETAISLADRFPDAEIHFDGACDEKAIAFLAEHISKERLAVWLPYRCAATSWVKVPTANEELCKRVKTVARLGIWILSDSDQLREATERFDADIIETTGKLKPRIADGILPDTHMHSEHSHDARDPIEKMAKSAVDKNIDVICITDHCDVEYCRTLDVEKLACESFDDARKTNGMCGGKPKILAGIEMGESMWYPQDASHVLHARPFDTVIGSVHAVRYPNLERPYAPFDFSEFTQDDLDAFATRYFDDMLDMIATCDFDVLAHLTCPFRYINGKYHLEYDVHRYEEKIDEILRRTIARGAALEINTSCLDSAYYDEFMPEVWILERYRALGGYLITFGSDAHIAENVAHGFDRLIPMLKKCGFENVFYYENRTAVACRLPE